MGASRPVSRVLYGAKGEPPARDDHSSGTTVAGRLERSTRATARKRVGRRAGNADTGPVAPIRSCSRWGLPCRRRCRLRGALLPHPFTLTRRGIAPVPGGLLSVALSLGSPPPDVIRHRVSVEPGLSSALARDGRPAGWPDLRRGGRPEREGGPTRFLGRSVRPGRAARPARRCRRPAGTARPRRDDPAPSRDCRTASRPVVRRRR